MEDFGQVGGAIQQVANLGGTLDAGDPLRDDVLDQLDTFTAHNFILRPAEPPVREIGPIVEDLH